MTTKASKFNKHEKNALSKMLFELVVLAKFFETLPEGDKKDKEWAKGVIFGIKYTIAHLTDIIGDLNLAKNLKDIIEWEKEIKNMMGKTRYKNFQKLNKKNQ